MTEPMSNVDGLTAWNHGYRARMTGVAITGHPFESPIYSEQKRHWIAGWQAMDELLEKSPQMREAAERQERDRVKAALTHAP